MRATSLGRRSYYAAGFEMRINSLIDELFDGRADEIGMNTDSMSLAVKHLQWARNNILKAKKGIKDNADKS